MSEFLQKAIRFATDAHRGQVRKYTGQPYINHPLTVMTIVSTVTDDTSMACAAVLHDVVEDTPITHADIKREFGPVIGRLVFEVTDISRPADGNRAARKALDRKHLSVASPEGMTIKLADMLDNGYDIQAHDADFAKVYMAEMAKLLPLLWMGDEDLFGRVREMLVSYKADNLGEWAQQMFASRES